MATPRPYQSNFTAGEWSPLLNGRSDLRKYANAAREMTNVLVQKHGGFVRRPGTQHVAEVKFPANSGTRLIEFQFSVDQTYVLEVGAAYIRFYRDQTQMTQVAGDPSPGTITEIVAPWADAELIQVKFTQSADVLYLTHPDYEVRTLTRTVGNDTDPTTWVLAPLDTQDGPYLDENTSDDTLDPDGTSGTVTIVASAANTFVATDVGRLIRLTHPTSNTAGWAIITVFTNDTTVDVEVQVDFTSLAPTTRWRLGRWSDTTGWPWAVTFHEQRLIFGGSRSNPTTYWGSEVGDFPSFSPSDLSDVTTVIATHAVTGTIDSNELNGIQWILSDPRGLLIMTSGGVFARPKSDAPLTPDDTGMRLQDPTGSHATARALRLPGAALMVAKSGRRVHELIYNFDVDRVIAPDLSILAEHISESDIVYTAYQLEPNSIMWAILTNGILVGMTYERTEQIIGWHRHPIAGSLNGSDNPTVDSIASIRQGSDDQLWMIVQRTINGMIRRYVEFQQVQLGRTAHQEDAWHLDSALAVDNPLPIANATQANPVIITTSVAHGLVSGDFVRIRDVVGMTELNQNVYKVAGETATTFQLRDPDDDSGIDGTGFTGYISAGAVYKHVTVISGLGHLEGETVGVLADGGRHPTKVVAGGSITLEYGASRILVGLAFDWAYESMPIVDLTPGADTRGAANRIAQVNLWLNRSIGGRLGTNEKPGDIIEYRSFGDEMKPVELFTGVLEAAFPGSSGPEATIRITGDGPLPFNLLSMSAEITSDEL